MAKFLVQVMLVPLVASRWVCGDTLCVHSCAHEGAAPPVPATFLAKAAGVADAVAIQPACHVALVAGESCPVPLTTIFTGCWRHGAASELTADVHPHHVLFHLAVFVGARIRHDDVRVEQFVAVVAQSHPHPLGTLTNRVVLGKLLPHRRQEPFLLSGIFKVVGQGLVQHRPSEDAVRTVVALVDDERRARRQDRIAQGSEHGALASLQVLLKRARRPKSLLHLVG
mmetsp:Transcript_108152/g.304602  ORF Transcript_108152/g.304602 Transcript_108152/m.304602 type:complete len:226 (-) Transcript_108152:787-1464(-)